LLVFGQPHTEPGHGVLPWVTESQDNSLAFKERVVAQSLTPRNVSLRHARGIKRILYFPTEQLQGQDASPMELMRANMMRTLQGEIGVENWRKVENRAAGARMSPIPPHHLRWCGHGGSGTTGHPDRRNATAPASPASLDRFLTESIRFREG